MSEKEKRGVGRPSLGLSKQISVTLSESDWKRLDEIKDSLGVKSTSELIRFWVQEWKHDDTNIEQWLGY
jgi:Arc/MetJ-type ribon-helix-helix transcriptional regulator